MQHARYPPSSNRDWLTARVATPDIARRFIRRLDALGFDYQVVLCDRHLRILVRRDKQHEVLDSFDEMTRNFTSGRRYGLIEPRRQLILLFAIPFGGFVGTVLAAMIGFPSPVIGSCPAKRLGE